MLGLRNLNKLHCVRFSSNKHMIDKFVKLTKEKDIDDIHNLLKLENIEPQALIDHNHSVLYNAIIYNKPKIIEYYCSIEEYDKIINFLKNNNELIVNNANSDVVELLRKKYKEFNDCLNDVEKANNRNKIFAWLVFWWFFLGIMSTGRRRNVSKYSNKEY